MAPSTYSTDLKLTDSAFKTLIVESILSDDGKSIYVYKIAMDGGQQQSRIVYEKWELMCNAPELAESTTRLLSTDGWETKGRGGEDSHRPAIHLVPSKWTLAPPNLYDLIRSVSLKADLGANAQDDWSRLLTEYWGCASYRDNFLILCRRKRINPSSDGDPVSRRRSREAARLARQRRWHRPNKTYNEELDFDEIPESEGSSEAGGFDLVSEPEVADDVKPNSISSLGSLELLSSTSGRVSEMEDARSLSEIGSIESGSSNSWETSCSVGSTASSSSRLSSTSTMSAERLRIYEFLTSSDNPWHYHEITLQHPAKGCDLCGRDVWRWLHCFECSDSDFDICLGCVDKGQWCLDRSHELLEADGDGPITMRRSPQWAVTNEIRVYDKHDDGTENCVLEFSAAREDLLHESQPAIHPSAPIFAWPLSPTKLLLASFEGDKERIIQGMKSFVKHGQSIASMGLVNPTLDLQTIISRTTDFLADPLLGRKVDVQVRFSDTGSCLFVASIEAVKFRGQRQEQTYNLHMQVAVLQLRFDGEALTHPMPLCERHHDLMINMPSTLETLPFVWTWTAQEVCLTLTGDQISLWRVSFNPSGQGRFHLGPVETSAAQLPLLYQNMPSKAQLIHVREDNVPVVALTPLHVRKRSEAPSMCYIRADRPWCACDEKDHTNHVYAEVPQKTLFTGSRDYESHIRKHLDPSGAPFSKMPQKLSRIRSEIRLLSLQPGSTDDALRCTLAKVSLKDLETAKSRLKEIFDTSRKTAEESQRPQVSTPEKKASSNWDPAIVSTDFQPRVLAHVDYSKTENSDVTIRDLIAKALSQSDNLGVNLGKAVRRIKLSNVDRQSSAVCSMAVEEIQEDRTGAITYSLHPKYNYEALSYVWGKSSENRTITLDGQKGVPVTDNLYVALRRLRRPDHQRVLWVDALCINQSDVEERNWQVQMMGRIYSTAARVVVWLGDAEDPDPSLHDSTGPGAELSQEEDEATDEEDRSSSGSTKSHKVSQWQRDTLTNVLKTASPSWWTRAWVIQELVLAENVNVAFGAVEVNWSTFRSDMWSIWKSIEELQQLIGLRHSRRTWHYKGSIGETALLARHTDATDSKDKIYSLLSLVKTAQASLVRPNYDLKPVEVFIQATYADLCDNVYGNDIYGESPAGSYGGNLDRDVPKYPMTGDSDQIVQTGLRPDRFRILNWARPNMTDRRPRPGMLSWGPSWAVNFADPAVFTGDAEFRYGHERWTFDGNDDLNQRALLKLSEDNRQLTVRGAILGPIKDIVNAYPVRNYRQGPSEEIVTRLLKFFSNLPSENPYKVVSGPNAKLRTDELRTIHRRNRTITQTKPDEVTFDHEEGVTQILPHWDPDAEHGTVDWDILHSAAQNRGDCDVEGCRCAPSQFFRSWDSCVGLPHYARNISHYDSKKTSPWEGYCELLKPEKPRDPLRDEQSRFLLATSSGFIGLGPENADVGDVIALFYGSDIPVVLRPEGDHYLYRGRAWINGIMQGELWNIYQDPLLEEQDFVIL